YPRVGVAMGEWHKSACILCACNCGIEISLDGRRLDRIRGGWLTKTDPKDPDLPVGAGGVDIEAGPHRRGGRPSGGALLAGQKCRHDREGMPAQVDGRLWIGHQVG